MRNNLANGAYNALSSSLYTLNYSKVGGINPTLPAIPAGVNGAVLRYNAFPENFVRANPQFSTATLQTNIGNSNYHSMQAEVTLRPTAGLSLQGSYTWSKSLGRTGAFTNPVDRGPDYTLQAGHRAHDFRTNGTFELPIGPNRLLLANSSGALARIVEGWTMSWIFNTTSGAPADIDAATMLYANGVPDVVGPFIRVSVRCNGRMALRPATILAASIQGWSTLSVRVSPPLSSLSARSMPWLTPEASSSCRIPSPGRGAASAGMLSNCQEHGAWTVP